MGAGQMKGDEEQNLDPSGQQLVQLSHCTTLITTHHELRMDPWTWMNPLNLEVSALTYLCLKCHKQTYAFHAEYKQMDIFHESQILVGPDEQNLPKCLLHPGLLLVMRREVTPPLQYWKRRVEELHTARLPVTERCQKDLRCCRSVRSLHT